MMHQTREPLMLRNKVGTTSSSDIRYTTPSKNYPIVRYTAGGVVILDDTGYELFVSKYTMEQYFRPDLTES